MNVLSRLKPAGACPALVAALPLALLLTACGGGGGSTSPTPPKNSSVELRPVDFTSEQSLSALAKLTLQSSAALQAEGLSSHVLLERWEPQGEYYLPVLSTVLYNSSTQRIEVQHAAPLASGVRYRIRLQGLLDAAGLPLPEQSFTFKTERTVLAEQVQYAVLCVSQGVCSFVPGPVPGSKVVWSYNTQGLLEKTQQSWPGPDNMLGTSDDALSNTLYSYTPEQLLAQEKDDNGTRTYTYATNKRLLQEDWVTENGQASISSRYSYEDGPAGFPIKATIQRSWKHPSGETGADQIVRSYNNWGQLLSENIGNTTHITHRYNAQGQLEETTHDPFFADAGITYTLVRRYEYAANGLLLQVQEFKNGTQLINSTQYEYNDKNQLIQSRQYSAQISQPETFAPTNPIPVLVSTYVTLAP